MFYEQKPFTEESKRNAIADIKEASVPNRDFYVLVLGATVFALCGIALDSIPVLIGSMIVAPLASPILALGLGVTMRDARLIIQSLGILTIASLLAAIVAAVVAHFLPPFTVNGTFISFIAHPFYDILIALTAGGIAGYGHVRAKVGNSMTGIGIAVSLMPPLVASAIALSAFDTALLRESSLIFVLNITGILIGSVMVFALFGLGKKHRK